jgi:predicted unusual protein kinase regulating ubiquinone biosynthesis (AarF/ABC1/UbiB family)
MKPKRASRSNPAIPLSSGRRSAALGSLAAAHAARQVSTRLAMLGRSETARALISEESTLRTAEQLVTVLGNLKGGAMKVGQMLSVLDLDLVPESHRVQFQEKLEALCNQSEPVPFAQMQQVIEHDLGPLGTVFEEFDIDPIASASIGQVYRARTRGGQDVVVKVKYPRIEQAIDSDIRNLRLFGKLLSSQWPTLRDGSLFDELARVLHAELDYRREARTQHRLAYAYRKHPHIVIPDVLLEYCSDNVLVSDYFKGRPLRDGYAFDQQERDRIGEVLYRFYVGMLFERDEFCGDPHAGNILLGLDNRICILDFGLFHKMHPHQAENERRLLHAAIEGNSELVRQVLCEADVMDEDSKISAEECLDFISSACPWHVTDARVAVTPALATGSLVLAMVPQTDKFSEIRRQNLPSEHVISRRAEFLTFGILGQLRAEANWHQITREWLYDAPPSTPIGREQALWRAET